MMSVSSISVVIPTYNRAALIGRAIESVLSQRTAGPVDVIVVDDGSTDDTVQIIRDRFQSVRVISQPNSGPSAARNRGILAATGDYIAFLDSDDELVDDSLDSRANALDANPDVGMVCGNFVHCGVGNPPSPPNFEIIDIFNRARTRTGHADAFVIENFFDAHLRKPLFITSGLMVRRSIAVANEVFFDERLAGVEDWEYCLRYSLNHQMAFILQPVVKRHVHGNNLACSETSSDNSLRVDRIVLEYPCMSLEQREFARERLADDLYEYAYAACWRRQARWLGFMALCESMAMRITMSKVKLFVAYVMPSQMARRIRKKHER